MLFISKRNRGAVNCNPVTERNMKKYKGSSRSGIDAYEIVDRGIVLEFKDSSAYLYDYTKPGKQQVENMRELAEKGNGLATYLNQHVRDNYKRKLG